MKLHRAALAGTLESSDVLVEISPGGAENTIEVDSVVLDQFGEALERTAREMLEQFAVTGAQVVLKDRGALECTVRARLETAIRRAGREAV